ncbi:unnamed protein product, partial [Leptidea sinapis]
MSQQLELLIENQLQWTTVSYVAPELQMKEIKPFVLYFHPNVQNNIRNEMASAESVKEIMYRDTQVILQLQLTDGASYVYRLSLSKFHEMRYTIANALK